MIDKHYLTLLSKDFPNIRKASTEIVNLNAILNLPKATEYFFSDLHGEHEAFIHMVKSASGVIRSKVDEHLEGTLTEEERDELSALIYDAEAVLKLNADREDYEEWVKAQIHMLIVICRSVSTKYTRSKVRKRMHPNSAYILDELLHADDEANRAHYYSEIINSIVKCGIVEDFIIEMAETISRLAVDRLHIVGDVYDRGSHPDCIMDYLMDYHDVDFQWGNHDMVWMGAATGSWACIANAIRMNVSYNNFDMMELGYGLNLRALAIFAQDTYGSDPCEYFYPHLIEDNKFDLVDPELAAKMHKAIAIIQFKVEGQRIMAHPEYNMEGRLLLDKVNYEEGTIVIKGKEYELRDKNFPTVDPDNPYKLTPEEEVLMNSLEASFLMSEKLQKHIKFLYSHGGMYKCVNGNLLYHGAIPMTEEGEFQEVTINGKKTSGKAYYDYLDEEVRKAYFAPKKPEEIGQSGDLMWYLWCNANSPLFGKDQMTTFERCFIADKKTHKEYTIPYYSLIKKKEHCEKILEEFGLDADSSHIINGHVPVKQKDGENPIKGEGKLFVIDGGMSKAYQKTTGIAGYTFIFNSRFMALAEHEPYKEKVPGERQEFVAPTIHVVETLQKRMRVKDTDIGVDLQTQVDELEALVEAYRKGELKESFS